MTSICLKKIQMPQSVSLLYTSMKEGQDVVHQETRQSHRQEDLRSTGTQNRLPRVSYIRSDLTPPPLSNENLVVALKKQSVSISDISFFSFVPGRFLCCVLSTL
jgi:hypothetical protein